MLSPRQIPVSLIERFYDKFEFYKSYLIYYFLVLFIPIPVSLTENLMNF